MKTTCGFHKPQNHPPPVGRGKKRPVLWFKIYHFSLRCPSSVLVYFEYVEYDYVQVMNQVRLYFHIKDGLDNTPPTVTVVPHAVTGNWKMAKAEVLSTGVQKTSSVSSRLIESSSIGGRVASLATTTTNRPSLVHCTVTGRQDSRWVKVCSVSHVHQHEKKPHRSTNTCFPIVAPKPIKAAVHFFTLFRGQIWSPTLDLLRLLYQAFIKRSCSWRDIWLLLRPLKRMRSLRFLQRNLPGMLRSNTTNTNNHNNTKQQLEKLHYGVNN